MMPATKSWFTLIVNYWNQNQLPNNSSDLKATPQRTGEIVMKASEPGFFEKAGFFRAQLIL